MFIVLREPNKRLWSSCLDKELRDNWKAKISCFNRVGCDTEHTMIIDDYHHHKFSFREFIGTKAECGPNDCHWNPQFDEVEDWTITNHAANFKDLANGTEWVLRNLGGNTWEKNGATG